jgi:hypothetical protein
MYAHLTILEQNFANHNSWSKFWFVFLNHFVIDFWLCPPQGKKDIVFRFIIEYSSLMDFFCWPLGTNILVYSDMRIFLKDDILACVKT